MATNPYNNKVQLADGTVLIDLTDTTATASEILQGYGAYGADGAWMDGEVANGSATIPTVVITANPSLILDSDTGLVTAVLLASEEITPVVTAGYISSGTSGTITVSGERSAQLATKSGETFYPSTNDRTIQVGRYLIGDQIIKAVSITNLLAANVKDGITIQVGDQDDPDRITGVTGTFTDASTVSSGQIAASSGKILAGYSAWVNGSEVLGNIPSRTTGDVTVIFGTINIPSGYYSSPMAFEAPVNVKYYYTGSSNPSSSIGSDGDLYFKTT